MQISTVIILVIIALLVIGYFWLIRIGDAANIAEWEHKSANRIDGLNRLFMRYYHSVPTVSIELPAEGPAIVVANHISGLDAFMLIASSNRPLSFLIAQ